MHSMRQCDPHSFYVTEGLLRVSEEATCCWEGNFYVEDIA